MSNAGLVIYNESNVLQIDDNYFNLVNVLALPVAFSQLFSSVLVGVGGGAYIQNIYILTVTINGTNLIPVIGESSIFICLKSVVVNGNGTTTFTFYSMSPGNSIIYFYGNPPIVGTSRFGLQTFNQSGVLTYDSTRPYLDIVTVINVLPMYASNYQVRTTQLSQLAKIGVILNQFYGLGYQASFPPEFPGDITKYERWAEGLFIRSAGNTAYFRSSPISSSSTGGGTDWEYDYVSSNGPILLVNMQHTL